MSTYPPATQPAFRLESEAPAGRGAIQREAQRLLSLSGYLALREVRCESVRDEIRLLGRVPSYFLKQLAQEVVAPIEGVRSIVNLIQVMRYSPTPLVQPRLAGVALDLYALDESPRGGLVPV
jgi:hypothetical protein